MTFKKNGRDPIETNRSDARTIARWVGAIAAQLGLVRPSFEETRRAALNEEHEYGRSKRPQQKHKKRRNMLIVSKRVRRKHRRAA